MKNTILLFILSIILFSCQYTTEIKKKRLGIVKDTILRKELKVDTLKKQNDLPKPKHNEVTVELSKKYYAVITLESYKDERQNNEWIEWRHKPKMVKIFNRISKREIQKKWFNGIYYSEQDDPVHEIYYLNEVWYADFNFDGKMDVAVRDRELGYRNFYRYDFYLATLKGYKFSKSFSSIMDDAIAYIELDVKNKKITSYREAEYDGCAEYKVQGNKAKLIKETRTSRPPIGPFYSENVDFWNGKKMVYGESNTFIKKHIWDKNYNYSLLSFEIKNSKKNIKIFIDNDTKLLYYTLLNRKNTAVDFDYSEKFNYNSKNNLLVFKDQNIEYKIYEGKNEVGVEITKNKKVSKLIGDIKSKKGSLSSIIDLKNNFEQKTNWTISNILIE